MEQVYRRNSDKKSSSGRIYRFKMATTVEEHSRPLKRQKLGIPDVYPQFPNQKEVFF